MRFAQFQLGIAPTFEPSVDANPPVSLQVGLFDLFIINCTMKANKLHHAGSQGAAGPKGSNKLQDRADALKKTLQQLKK